MSIIKNKIFIWIVFILFLISIVINFIFFGSIDDLYGDSRTINYAGILRGATQRLVKQELSNNPNDDLIEEIENIFSQLKGNEGKDQLIVMPDPKFQENLSKLEEAWKKLKEEIYLVRAGANSQGLYDSSEIYFEMANNLVLSAQEYSEAKFKLYALSEEYYHLSNNLVFSAQEHSENKMKRILFLRILLMISSGLIILIYGYQLISMMHLNRKNKRLTNLAYMDPDTRLPNRAYCSMVIADYQEMDLLPQMGCVYFDLNNLKKTNDTFGHEAGDKLIADFGRILKEVTKNYGFMSRNGGDEFVGFFEDFNRKKADRFMKRLYQRVNIYNSKKNRIKISFAKGIAFSDEECIDNINDLLTLADKRMYKDKKGVSIDD